MQESLPGGTEDIAEEVVPSQGGVLMGQNCSVRLNLGKIDVTFVNSLASLNDQSKRFMIGDTKMIMCN